MASSHLYRALMGGTALALIAGSSGQVAAQSAQQIEGASSVLQEIVVFGGARDERALLETPNAASVIGADELRRRSASTYEELLGDTTGLIITGGPRGISQEPNIRGFSDEQVVIRTDGVRQNFNLAHRGRFFTDPSILKQVEVLRGGASTLFGSGALGGVIFLETKDAADVVEPGEVWGGEVKLGFNSQGDELLGSGTFAAQAEQFDFLGFFAGRPRFDDVEDGQDLPIIGSEISSLNGIAKFGWEPNDDHRVEASFQIYRDNGETPPNANVQGTLPTTVAFGSIPNLVDRDIDNKTYRVAWDWTPSDSPLIDLSALVYYNDVSVEEDRLFDGRFNTTDFTTLGFEVTNVSDFDLGPVPVAVSYGIEFYQDQQEARSDGAPRLSTPDATQRFYAAFLQADFEVLPGLTITPGLRYDFYQLRPDGAFQDRDEGQPSPKIAINWQPTDDLQLFASAGRSFRAPTFTELYNDGLHFRIPTFPLGPPGSPVFTGLNLFVPTPDLDPERATQFELGGRYRMRDLVSEGDSLLFAANGYYSIVDGFIDLDVIGVDFATAAFNPITMQVEVNGSSTNQNVDAILFGFEADLEYNSEFWFASAGLSIPRGRARDGGNLGTIPPDRLVLTGGFRPHPDVEIGARASFVDGIEANETSNDPVGGYSVFDIFASWEPSSGPLEGAVFSAGIDNVTDTTYRIQPTEIRQPGLAFKAAASFKF